MTAKTLIAAAVALASSPALAQSFDFRTATPEQLYQYAVDSEVCEDRDVRSAVYNADRNVVEVECEEEAVGFVPLVGGLGGGGIAAIAGGLALALAGGSSTSSTD